VVLAAVSLARQCCNIIRVDQRVLPIRARDVTDKLVEGSEESVGEVILIWPPENTIQFSWA
jgi:hypothetical protein